ncbi:MAG: hypothetical protein IT461_16775 [Planctomycetes bacterium]|nr:hypothetical protein [Planctomycetota bacterium]
MKWLLVPALLLAGCTAAPVAQDAARGRLETSITATVIDGGASAKATREFYESLGLEVTEERTSGLEARTTLRVSDGATLVCIDFNREWKRDWVDEIDDLPRRSARPQPRTIHASWSVSVPTEVFKSLAQGKAAPREIDGRKTLVLTDPAGFTVLVREKTMG